MIVSIHNSNKLIYDPGFPFASIYPFDFEILSKTEIHSKSFQKSIVRFEDRMRLQYFRLECICLQP